MRTLKFRAWAHASEVMFYPDTDGGWELTKGVLKAIPNTSLMQFTGLHDKHGIEIYEGDVVKHGHHDVVGKVVWIDDYACFATRGVEVETLFFWQRLDERNLEIIGNTHENPDLLKEHPK